MDRAWSRGERLDERPVVADLPAEDQVAKPMGGGWWTEARWLRLGDRFLTRTGYSATVVGLTIRMERVKVYNLQVNRLQLYAVGQAGVLVHNKAAKNPNQFFPTQRQAMEAFQNDFPHLPLRETRSYPRGKIGWEIHPPDHGPGSLPHIKYWDWTGGKRGDGGISGHYFWESCFN